MAIPQTDRRQVIPPHFVAYLEKHRIYELFYFEISPCKKYEMKKIPPPRFTVKQLKMFMGCDAEKLKLTTLLFSHYAKECEECKYEQDMASSLAMTMPDDHILFLRNYLVDVASNRDKAKIMIIGPPFIDRKSIAKAVGFLLKLPVISICDITKGDVKYDKNPDVLASKFKEFLYSHELEESGWVLYDFPRDRLEVSALQKIGIRPTHAFQLIPSPQNIAERELWDEQFVGRPVKELTTYMKEYRRKLTGLRPSLKNVLKEVPLHKRNLETIAKNMAILGRQSTHGSGPMLPRVAIIGTRGSFKRTIACKMAESLGVVHVNMDELVAQALQKDNKLGQEMRELSSRNVRLYGKLIVAVLEDRLLEYDCLNKGWVLTGFPRDSKDLAVLDVFDTPPNRVIFVTNNSLEALERLTNRRINMYTGEYKHKDEVEEMEDIVVKEQFVIHPDDELVTVMKQQEEFDENVQGMLDYCKGNCIIVDGTGGLEAVMQRIFKSTLQASPPSNIRTTNVDDPIAHKKEVDIEEEINQAELKPVKSLLTGSSRVKSKSQMKVGFQKELSAKLATTSSKPADLRSDSAKPICIETELSGPKIKATAIEPNALKNVDELWQYQSCSSIFPSEIQTEWGKVRGKAKSYLSLPSASIVMNKTCLD